MIRRLWTLIIVSTGAVTGWWVVSRLLSRMGPEPVPGLGFKPAAPKEVIPLQIATQPVETPPSPSPDTVQEQEDDKGVGFSEEELRVYCLGCRAKQPVQEVEYTTTPQGRRRLSARCAVCGRKVSQFVRSE